MMLKVVIFWSLFSSYFIRTPSFCYYKVFNKLYDPFPSLQYFRRLNSIKSIHGLLLSTVTTKIDWILKFCYLYFFNHSNICSTAAISWEQIEKKSWDSDQLRSAWFAFSGESLHFLKIKWVSFLHSSRQYLISDAKKLIHIPKNLTFQFTPVTHMVYLEIQLLEVNF